MSETIFTSETNGDWGTATIWSTNAVPDSGVASVTIATDVTIASGESFTAGILDVAAPDLLNLAGSLDVTAGATVAGGLALDGGSLNTGGGLTLDTPASFLGGDGTVGGSIDNAGLIYAADGLLDLSGSVSGSGPLEIDLATGTSATLELGQGGTEAIAFVGLDPLSSAQGVLKLDQPGGYSGTISGFGFGETIDLAGLAPGSLTESFSGNSAQGTLTISNGSSTVAILDFDGDYTNRTFSLTADGSGGTEVELLAPSAAHAISNGDWGAATIWSTDLVPDSGVVSVTIENSTDVSIAATESFVAGSLKIHSQGELRVFGSLAIAGRLSVDADASGGFVGLDGVITAGTIFVGQGLGIQGIGTLGSSGTLTNDGLIEAVSGLSGDLVVAPALYVQSGALVASDSSVLLSPSSGPSGFANLVNGTLTGGTYTADNGGVLLLPGPISALNSATIFLDEQFFAKPAVVAGSTDLENSLNDVVNNAVLRLSGYNYITADTLTVDGGTIVLNDNANLSSAELVLTGSFSELSVGAGTVLGGVDNDGVIVVGGGGGNLLKLSGVVTGNGVLEIGSDTTLEIVQGSAASVTFNSLNSPSLAGGVLRLDDPTMYSGIVSGFASAEVNSTANSDAIDLQGFAPNTLGDVYHGTTAGGTLEILAPGSIVASLAFAGDYTQDRFALVPDGNGGTEIELVVPCFTRGTHIATPSGEVAVEDLRVGDRVLTASGDARPIVWIGQRRVDCRRHPRPNLVHPVRIRAGAFADNQPVRDLLLSPDHALFHDGVLIPVGQLINGASIVQERSASVHYFHIELDRHDVVLAEGLAAESYLNTGNRRQFENGAATISLFADFTPLDEDGGCAPRLTRGPIVEALGRQLWQSAVAQAAGQRTSPEVRVEVDGRVLRPAVVKGRLHRFLLPAQAREARIVSPERIRLGGALVDGRIVEPENPGRIALPARFGRSGAVLLELLLHDAMPSRLPATVARAA